MGQGWDSSQAVHAAHRRHRFGRVAVLGAGVMGAQIAAHLVNCGVPVVLFDLPGDAADPRGPRAPVVKAKEGLVKLEPPPLARAGAVTNIIAANYEHDLNLLRSCDLIIEAIAERLDLKHKLYEKIVPFLAENAILATNTSGIPLAQLSAGLPAAVRSRFCGVHFFNPPRYMNLVELIPGVQGQEALLDDLETFLVSALGKGVIRAKDTPNFIANRVGVFSLLITLHHADRFGISPALVDALTGSVLGRPKSATYRTADVVGLDTLSHVVNTMAQALPADPWHGFFRLPVWLDGLIKGGALGQKNGKGVYVKQGKEIWVFDPATQKHVAPVPLVIPPETAAALKEQNWGKRFEQLRASTEPAAQFLWSINRDLLHYCAYFLEEIADTARILDLALRWGYGWQQGPFELWQAAGWQQVRALIEADIAAQKSAAAVALPAWATDSQRVGVSGPLGAWHPGRQAYVPSSSLPVYQKQLFPEKWAGEQSQSKKSIWENAGVTLWKTQEDGIAILSFKTKMNTVNEAVLDGILEAITVAEKDYFGLVLWQSEAPFSAGADLQLLLPCLKSQNWQQVDVLVRKFQAASQRLKYAQIPTVAAVSGLALGGGCEFAMHCHRAVVHLETYIGLVEVGVGILPAGGGCKELALRAARAAQGANLLPLLQKYFQNVAMASVSKNGFHAQEMGILLATDLVIPQVQELLFIAKTQIHALRHTYRPPLPEPIAAAGLPTFAALRMQLTNMRAGGFISAHDELISTHVARVLCGGEIEAGTLVDEEWFLALEREAFLALCQTNPTAARVEHMLTTGKPLRN